MPLLARGVALRRQVELALLNHGRNALVTLGLL